MGLSCLLAPGCQGSFRPTSAHSADTATPPPVELTAEVDGAEAKIGDPVIFRVTLDADPSLHVRLPEVGYRIEGLRIVDMGKEGPKKREGRVWSQRWYKVVADLAGSYILPAVKLRYTDTEGKERTAETAQLFLEISSTLDKNKGDKDIRDIKPLAKVRRKISRSFLLISAGGLLALGLTTCLLLFARKKTRARNMERSPEEMARGELETLDASGLLEEQRYREYVFSLSLIFRRYLERRFHVPAAEQTTEEIFISLRQADQLDKDLKERARTFLEETDPIKYRGLEPGVEETEAWRERLLTFMDLAVRFTEASASGEVN